MSGRGSPSSRDVVVAVVLLVVAQVELHLPYALEGPPGAAQVVFAVLLTVPLAWRTRAPWIVCPLVLAVFSVQPAVTTWPNSFAESIAGFVVPVVTLVVHSRTWRRAVAGGVLALALLAAQGFFVPDEGLGLSAANSLYVVLVWSGSALVRRYAERARSSAVAATRAEARAATLLAEERSRIARELHDVVAHGIGVIVLQARGGRKVLATDPDRARLALDEIEQVSAQCLQEMRRLLGVLRSEGGVPAGTEPLPGLAALPGLVTSARPAGLSLDADLPEVMPTLPPTLDLSAYRIAQEAVTNVLRHAPNASASLRVSLDDQQLSIVVLDDGRGAAGPEPGGETPGHGLIGMRERAQIFGGAVDVGPRAGGGFSVRARLPVVDVVP